MGACRCACMGPSVGWDGMGWEECGAVGRSAEMFRVLLGWASP